VQTAETETMPRYLRIAVNLFFAGCQVVANVVLARRTGLGLIEAMPVSIKKVPDTFVASREYQKGT
ncbi:MAG: hypothetical protein ACKN9U_00280, partial [Pirellulaceae bacterium]